LARKNNGQKQRVPHVVERMRREKGKLTVGATERGEKRAKQKSKRGVRSTRLNKKRGESNVVYSAPGPGGASWQKGTGSTVNIKEGDRTDQIGS